MVSISGETKLTVSLRKSQGSSECFVGMNWTSGSRVARIIRTLGMAKGGSGTFDTSMYSMIDEKALERNLCAEGRTGHRGDSGRVRVIDFEL
ncbi:hypothetical protein EV1_043543 [Malus domestica]